eukprot:8596435-Pyramimonas_sp.AAC.1
MWARPLRPLLFGHHPGVRWLRKSLGSNVLNVRRAEAGEEVFRRMKRTSVEMLPCMESSKL